MMSMKSTTSPITAIMITLMLISAFFMFSPYALDNPYHGLVYLIFPRDVPYKRPHGMNIALDPLYINNLIVINAVGNLPKLKALLKLIRCAIVYYRIWMLPLPILVHKKIGMPLSIDPFLHDKSIKDAVIRNKIRADCHTSFAVPIKFCERNPAIT